MAMDSQAATAVPAPGTLFGIGVGPGAPDLLTMRAVEVLRKVEVIAGAASPRNEHSVALSIASQYLPLETTTLRLDFPMTRDRAKLAAAWEESARKVAGIARSGKNIAFLTLGDPLMYSTFGYLMQTMARIAPDVPIEVVPGIASFQAAAAKSLTVLCEGEETLLILSGSKDQQAMEQVLAVADSAVILKTYKNSGQIYAALTGTGRKGEIVFVSRLGFEDEILVRGLTEAPDKPEYLSLILSTPVRSGEK
jgi:precorrin-2/cobalt-factor-2 C20-methyltransferase